MRRLSWFTSFIHALAVLVLLQPNSICACVACFGKSDSAMAQGMNMGIFSLLAVITCVLIAISGFFLFLARRAAKLSRSAPTQNFVEQQIYNLTNE